MPPADKTRTCAWSPRPPNESIEYPPCKESADGHRSATSGAILLLNFDDLHREALVSTLQRCRYQVIAPAPEDGLLRDVEDDQLRSADFVIVDVTRIDHRNWTELSRVCRTRGNDGLPLMVACWSRRDHGPTFQLMVEKLGARYVYVQQ